MFITRSEGAKMDSRIQSVESDLQRLQGRMNECDALHEDHVSHRRRSDDAVNKNTESNILLAKSITDMNITVSKIVGLLDLENGAPDLKLVREARIAYTVNKRVLLSLAAIVTALGVLYTAYVNLV